MNCCGLSSTGLQNVDANEITSDNVTVFSSLNASEITSDNVTIFSSLSVSGINILNSLSSINNYIGSSTSSLNITGTSQINFNAGATCITTINLSGLSVFSNGRSEFPRSFPGWYNISERLDNLYLVMQDTPLSIINYDQDYNTRLRVGHQDFVSNINTEQNYPKQIQFCDFLNKKVGYFNTSGLSLLDANGNYNNISSYFTQTGNSLLLCSNKTRVDAGGHLNVFNMSSTTILGTMYTGGTWLNVADTLNNNISSITTLSNSYNTVLSQLTTISGNASNIASIANYYSGLQSSLAVTNGVVTGSGLVLAFNLKEDRYDVQLPLYKKAPTPLNGQYFNQLSLKYNGALSLDVNNNLTINTVDFLTPTYGDLALMPTPNGIASASTSYVVVGQLSQPMTCKSSLNVSGITTLANDVSCLSSLNVSGTFSIGSVTPTSQFLCAMSDGFTWLGTSYNVYDTHVSLFKNGSANYSINRGTANSHLFGDTSGTTYLNLNSTNNYSNNPFVMASSLTVSGNTIMNSNLNVNANIYANNLSNKTPFNIFVQNSCQINSTTYYRYDLDLRYYTTYITTSGVSTRVFKFICWLQSGNHINGLGNFSLNYDINYSQTSPGIINALAYGFPSTNNMAMNQITSNGLFIWKYTFDYITLFSTNPANLQCLIIDYL